jgi:hypothetical protein
MRLFLASNSTSPNFAVAELASISFAVKLLSTSGGALSLSLLQLKKRKTEKESK